MLAAPAVVPALPAGTGSVPGVLVGHLLCTSTCNCSGQAWPSVRETFGSDHKCGRGCGKSEPSTHGRWAGAALTELQNCWLHSVFCWNNSIEAERQTRLAHPHSSGQNLIVSPRAGPLRGPWLLQVYPSSMAELGIHGIHGLGVNASSRELLKLGHTT